MVDGSWMAELDKESREKDIEQMNAIWIGICMESETGQWQQNHLSTVYLLEDFNPLPILLQHLSTVESVSLPSPNSPSAHLM